MPASTKRQFKFFKMLEKNPELRAEKGLTEKQVKEFTKENTGKKSYKNLPEKK